MKKTSRQAEHIPEKKYFRIGEVSKIVGVDTYVLRYWETEFPRIRPHRAKSRQRLYRKKDVEQLLQIKKLLHDEGYTISGARKVLKEYNRLDCRAVPASAVSGRSTSPSRQYMQKRLGLIKDELRDILQHVGFEK
ncbi:MAG TPA: MerR family transcriptional regulator [Desulfobulbus sp.]|nr:MerR family transcriptional regulator [Desulfobulbus sp.]